MSTVQDVVRRTLYMSIFFMLIPLGAYTIHTGMSAMVAGVSYGILSLLMPIFYLRSSESGFGPKVRRIPWYIYALAWALVQGGTFLVFNHLDLSWLWNLSTIGRDVVFAIIMYCQVTLALILSLVGGRNTEV